MQLNEQTLNGARNTRSAHLISVLSFQGQALGQWDRPAQIIMSQAQPLAGWCWVLSSVHAQMGPCSYIELRVWRCRTNRRTHYSDMTRTSGTYRNTWTDSFGCRHTMLPEYHHCQHLNLKQWIIIQQHCCLAAVFDVDVDPFQKKKKIFIFIHLLCN